MMGSVALRLVVVALSVPAVGRAMVYGPAAPQRCGVTRKLRYVGSFFALEQTLVQSAVPVRSKPLSANSAFALV